LAQLADIRALAKSLHLVVIPLDALNDRVREQSHRFIGAGLDEFSGWTRKTYPELCTYVLCPIEAYSIKNHVMSATDLLPVYDPSNNAGLAGIQIMLPMLSELVQDVKELGRRMDASDERLSFADGQRKKVDKRLSFAETQINRISSEVARDRDEAIRRGAEQIGTIKQLESLLYSGNQDGEGEYAPTQQATAAPCVPQFTPHTKSKRAFCFDDPLVFAVPKGTDVAIDHGLALIGACWGNKMDVGMLRAVGVLPIKGQREIIEKRWAVPPWHPCAD